jgi:hypothetical protein
MVGNVVSKADAADMADVADATDAGNQADQAELAEYRQLKASGRIHLTDYPMALKARDFRALGVAARFEAIFDRGAPETLDVVNVMREHVERFGAISFEQGDDPRAPHWSNGYVPPMDGLSLYAMVARHRPRIYMEVGSGNSTKFVRRAIEDLGLETRIVSIDPYPRAEIDDLCDEVIRQPVEMVDPAIFSRLGPDDLLFIDNSHAAFSGSDVTVFFMETLPSLVPGVIYGVHDIILPIDYGSVMAARGYNEQYLMGAYLLGGADGDQVVFPASHVAFQPNLCAQIPFPDHPGMQTEGTHGGALWMRKG